MPEHLITLSIGPVQDFIAAARRTRDLWFGSWVLSEISKAAAYKIYSIDNKALIFPSSPKPEKDLKPCDSEEDYCFNVGNKLLFRTETDKPLELIEKAKKAAKKRWNEIAKQALDKAKLCRLEINEDHWNKQREDVLEFFAAWLECDGSKSYKQQRERLDQLLNARKNTREFEPNPITAHGIPKSSLDGLRENVIKKELTDDQARKTGINKKEQLDCVGLIKRLALNPDQFTPISRIALDPWLRGNINKGFAEINQQLDVLATDNLCSRVNGNQEAYKKLPYDGQLLYPDRLKTMIEDKDNQDFKEKLKTLKKSIKKLDLSKPNPYMAILLADGDRMGKLLDEMETIEEHQEISQTLANFATLVPKIVREYHGHCIYAGGDDVLALLPLDCAIECSRELADIFKTTMENVTGLKDQADIKPPTLSVGLGISHLMTPMGKQIDLARKAEKLAKGNELQNDQPKNALAIIIQPRSGAEISFREKWLYGEDQLEKSAEAILGNWIQAHLKNAIPSQAGYNLRDESLALKNWRKSPPPKSLIIAETARILEAKRTKEGKIESKQKNKVAERVAKKGMRAAADELIMTYRIAEAYQQAKSSSYKKQQEGTSHV